MSKFSVIIPIYNKEKYLENTLESIINQTIHKDLEIILIDDKSTDQSLRIADNFANKYSKNNIVLVKNEFNIGVSETRNKGIKMSTGEYISFIDADDQVTKRFYECIYIEAERYGFPDIIETELKTKIVTEKYNYGVFYSSPELIHFNLDYFLNRSSCNKVYRNNFIKDKKIPDTSHEDFWFTQARIIECENILKIYNSDSYYIYIPNKDSRHQQTKQNRIISLVDIFDSYIWLLKQVKNLPNFELHRNRLEEIQLNGISNFLKYICKDDNYKNIEELKKCIYSYCIDEYIQGDNHFDNVFIEPLITTLKAYGFYYPDLVESKDKKEVLTKIKKMVEIV